MPIYQYMHPVTEAIIEVVQSMNDVHEYSEDGVVFKRVWSKPQAAFDTHVDPHSAKDFVKATRKKDTMGGIWDRSADLSNERASRNGGVDPVKQGFYNEWSAKRKGQLHPELRREQALKAAEKVGLRIKGL